MTAVPDEHVLTLICDSCGDTITDSASPLTDAEVVWPLLAEQGWTGSPLAAGPHHCPHCSRQPRSGGGHHARCAGHGPGGIAGIDHRAGVTVVAATGDIDLDSGDTLRGALRHAADMGGDVVVDLSEVHVIDSTGLSVLVRAHRDARDREATLALAAVPPFVRTVLHTMRLEAVFPLFDGADEAVAALTHDRNRPVPAAGR
ncbi:STAS domain-containing protein [Micromonospora sp. PLK6-60]|uniref:STAS domain-containing protein n=1 Tax=Micromonospora sp. PLK6-60 TaxID=2873383 RepID=UPI001CA72FDB|nr:STAS domain-containing protein [Micromonospora sp. PLK6-60]MBY8870637.1 STAS domain-containing protein [Micromonospora sp. PLK6-60]